jgi:hypothetical protein
LVFRWLHADWSHANHPAVQNIVFELLHKAPRRAKLLSAGHQRLGSLGGW